MILKFLFNGLFLFSIVSFVMGNVNQLGRPFTISNYEFGDLYDYCLVDHFRYEREVREYREDDTFQNADIITIGDSFFRSTYEGEHFSNLLEEHAERDVYHVPVSGINPAEYLKNMDMDRSSQKILILSTVEREIFNRNYSLQYAENLGITDKIEKSMVRISNELFVNEDVRYFLKRNILLFHFNRMMANVRFNMLGEIDGNIDYYSKERNFLFFKRAGDFNRRIKYLNEIEALVKDLKALHTYLDSEYNIKLIFVPIPNKYSIYHDYIDTDRSYQYDNFMPDLSKMLTEEGVDNINVYELFTSYRDSSDAKLLYYEQDTHYSYFGRNMLAEKTASVLDSLMVK